MLLSSRLTLLTVICATVGIGSCLKCSPLVTLQATPSKVEVLAYPLSGTYFPNSNCFWKLEAPETKCIRFRFTHLSIDGHHGSYRNDYFQVFDDKTTGSNKKISFNGNHYVSGDTYPLSYYYTSSRYALMNFVSDDNLKVGTGFSLEFTAVDCECKAASGPEDIVVEIGKVGTLNYPRDSKLNYQSNSVCWWNLTAPADKCIRLQFKFLSVEEYYSKTTPNDYITVYQDSTWNSDKKLYFNGNSYVSGYVNPKPYYYVNGRSAVVAFTADADDIYGYDGHHGFSLEYVAVDCECKAAEEMKKIQVESGKVSILSYPENSRLNYQSNSVCWWNLTAPADKCIRLQFKFLSVEEYYSRTTPNDYLTFFDDTTWNSDRKMTFNNAEYISGFVSPKPFYYSSGSSALATFTSDADDNYGDNGFHGFQLAHEAVECECRPAVTPAALEARSGMVETISYPTDNTFNYRSNADCWWNISAPEAHAKCIKLQFTFLSTEQESSRNGDYVIIYDDKTWSSGKKLGNQDYFSGGTYPRIIYYSSGRAILVRFISNGNDHYGYNGRHGFILNYISETDASKCGRPDTCKVCVTTCS